MSSKFLDSGDDGGIIELLQSGSQNLNLGSLIDQSLVPGIPVCASNDKKLISRQIGPSDLNFSVVTNPMTVDFNMGTHAITNVTTLNGINPNNIIQTPSVSDLDMNTYSISNVINLNGIPVSDLVVGPSSVINNNLTAFDTTSGKLLKDSGISITTLSGGPFLPLTGGTLSGNLNLGTKEITNASAIRFNNTNVTMGSSSTIGASTTNNINIGNATIIPASSDSNIVMGNQASMTGLGTAGNIVMGPFASSASGGYNISIGQQSVAKGNGVTIGKESISAPGGVVVGYRSTTGSSRVDSIIIGRDNVSSGDSADILGVNRTNLVSNTLLLGNGAYTNIRANTGCDLGTSSVPFQSLYYGNIIGSSKTSAINEVVTNAGTSTNGNIASLSGTTGKIITDSGVSAGQVTTNATNIGTNTTNISTLQTKTQNQSATAGNTNFTGTLQQAGVNVATTTSIANLVTGPASAVNNNIVSYDLTTGKLVKDSGVPSAQVTTNASNITTLQTQTQNITASAGATTITGTITGGTNSRSTDNILSSTVNPTYGNLPMWAVTAKVFDDSGVSSFNVVTGPASATNNNLASYNLATGKIIKDSGILSTNVVQGPASSVTTNLAAYNGTTGKLLQDSGLLTANIFLRTGTVAMTGSLNLNTQSITNGGVINVTNTTDSSSVSTGSIITAGGVGIGKKLYTGDAITVSNTTNPKVSLTNTTATTGKNYEVKSNSAGNFEIIDATSAATRFTIQGNSFGFNSVPIASGGGCIYIASGTLSAFPAASGGMFCTQGGNLFWYSQGGKVTQLATNT